jgi:Arc/MetJ-type ribon-helix-helix transcriptional regulator
MSYQLPVDLENQFAAHLSTGRYANMEAVLRQALATLNAREQEVAAIQEGIDAMEQGLTQPLDEFDREFRAANGIPLDL